MPTTAARTSDTDPDWFQVMYSEDSLPVYGSGDSGANVTIFDGTGKGGIAPDLSLEDGDLFESCFRPATRPAPTTAARPSPTTAAC